MERTTSPLSPATKRLPDVMYRAKSGRRSPVIESHLIEVANRLGLQYRPELYPEVIDLAHATKGFVPDLVEKRRVGRLIT
jgi:hypothetical protein